MLLFRVFTELPYAGYLWGPNGVGEGSSRYVLGQLGTILDRAFTTKPGTLSMLLVLTAGAFGLIVGFRTRACTILVLGAFYLLEQRLPALTDGGDNITRLVLMYMVVLLPAKTEPAKGSLAVWLHNVAVLAIALQVMIMYVTSGLMKAYGEEWHHGTALYYISQVEWFSLPSLRNIFMNPLVTTGATYVTVLYQTLFPVAMVSRLKLPWLTTGIVFHVAIAIFMGLIPFSTAMIGLELFLISDPEYARIEGKVPRLGELARLRSHATRAHVPEDAPSLAMHGEVGHKP